MRNFSELTKLKNYTTDIKAKKYEIHSIPLHWHNFYEIELVISGDGTHMVNGQQYRWTAGEMHFLRLTDFHEINLAGNSMVHLIQFSPSHLSENLLKTINANGRNFVTYLSEKDFSYMDSLCSMLEEPDYGKELKADILNTVMALFLKSCGADGKKLSDIYENEPFSKIVMYIAENFRDNLTLENIAERFFISKNHLCFYFKKNMGKTVMEYIKELRLEYAAKLTKTTQIKSIEICHSCGYGSISNFLRDFKKHFGISPMEMRRKHNENA